LQELVSLIGACLRLESGRLREILGRVKTLLRFYKGFQRRCGLWAYRLGGTFHVAVTWPVWWLRPWRRKSVKLWSVGKGIGDEVMCTMVFDALKKANAECHITFVTRYPDLFREHPSLKAILPDSDDFRKGAIPLTYGRALPPPRPLGHLLAECVGLVVVEPQAPSLPQPSVSEAFQARVSALKRPLVVVQPRPSNWTPNKDWALDRWDALVRLLVPDCTVIECGTLRSLSAVDGMVSMAGETSLLEFTHLVSQADLFIGPPSGGMHLAAAYSVPSVILYGGYERPEGHQYPHVRPLYRQVPCAPCWLATACPNELQCLKAIRVEEVLHECKAALKGE